MERYLFAYGTLQEGGNVSFFEKNKLGTLLDFVCVSSIPGRLIHIHNTQKKIDYPGLIKTENNSIETVKGTLYKVLDYEKAFHIMDAWEGFVPGLDPIESKKRNFYERQQVPVEVTKDNIVVADVYVLNCESEYFKSEFIDNKGVVVSGDWIAYSKS